MHDVQGPGGRAEGGVKGITMPMMQVTVYVVLQEFAFMQ